MSALHDFNAHRQLLELVDKLTSTTKGRGRGRNSHVITRPDPDLLHDLKRACKSSHSNIITTFYLLYDRLKKQNSQVRLLALEVSANLFQRSRQFRALFASKFTHILSLIVRLRFSDALPDPQNAATCLHQRGLQLLQSWNTSHGTQYHQISLGYSYVNNAQNSPFSNPTHTVFENGDMLGGPSLTSHSEREQLEQRAAQRQYQQLLDGWDAQQSEFVSYLQQFNQAFELFEEEEESLVSLLMINTTATVLSTTTTTTTTTKHSHEDNTDIEWQDINDHDDQSTIQINSTVEDDDHTHRLASAALLLESLTDSYKSISATALPQLQNALRVMMRADVGDPGSARHARREQLLRTATDLKSQLMGAKERYDARHLDVIAMVQAQARRMHQRSLKQQVTGDDHGDDDKEKALPACDATTAPRDDDNPYRYIRDPTLSHKPGPYTVQLQKHSTTSTALRATTSTTIHHKKSLSSKETAIPSTVGVPNQQSIPDSVKKSLISKAPILPVGAFARVWDSDAPPVYMNNTGMEVSNHWGPVDVHQEMPSYRVDELFLYQPSTKQLPHAVESEFKKEPSLMSSKGNDTTKRMKIAQRFLTNAQHHVTDDKYRNTSGGRGAGLEASFVMRLGHADSQQAQRAMERQYNDAVISSGGDEALARLMTENGTENRAEEKQNGNKKQKNAQMSSRDRLRRRLLSGSAQNAAREDALLTEEDTRRDRFNNNWENK